MEQNGELRKWGNRFIEIISEAFPIGTFENWPICQVLFPHAEAALAYRPEEDEEEKYLLCWSTVLERAGRFAATQGNFSMAEDMNRRALEGMERAVGKEQSISKLAYLLQQQKQYEEATTLYERLCDGFRKFPGIDHPETQRNYRNYFHA